MATFCNECGGKMTEATVFFAVHDDCTGTASSVCERCGEDGHSTAASRKCRYYDYSGSKHGGKVVQLWKGWVDEL